MSKELLAIKGLHTYDYHESTTHHTSKYVPQVK